MLTQNKDIEELHVVTGVLRAQAENFGDGVTSSTRLLDKLNKKIDLTDRNLQRVTGRLGRTVAKVDVTVMWTVIAIEILLIIVIICI